MGVVDVCPKKQVDITAASKKLGCTNDTYGNNRYMCIPKENRASLFEFCYDGNMGIEEGGACLEATFGGIRRYNCSGFMYGCPDIPYHRYNVHKHPACQDINTKQRCYVLDRSCPSQRIDARNEKEMKEEGSSNLITYTAIGVSLFIVLIFAAAIFIWKCYLKKAPGQSNPDEDVIYEHVTERQDFDAMPILLQNAVPATRPLPDPNTEVLPTVHSPLYINEVSSTGPVPYYDNEGNASGLNDTVSLNTTFLGNPSRLNESVSPNTPVSGNGSRLNDTVSPNTPVSGNGSRLNDTVSPNTPVSGNGSRLNDTVSPNTPVSGNGSRLNDTVSPNTPVSGNRSRLNESVSPNTPVSGNGSRLNDTVSPNTPFSGNACRLNESVSQNTPFSDNSEQKRAIHSCNEFGTLFKDDTIASYEAEEKQKGMKVSIRFKEDKADKKEEKPDKKELPEMLNKNADMFRLKRDGKLATFKLLYEEDEEQDHDPPRQLGMRLIDDGHSSKPSGNGVG